LRESRVLDEGAARASRGKRVVQVPRSSGAGSDDRTKSLGYGYVRWTAGGRPFERLVWDRLLWEVSSCRVSAFWTGQLGTAEKCFGAPARCDRNNIMLKILLC
jgi:hypothetical protein